MSTVTADLNSLPTQTIDLFSEALDSISFPRWRFGIVSLAAGDAYSVHCSGFHAVTQGTCRVTYGGDDYQRQFDLPAGQGLLLTRDARHSIQANVELCDESTIVFGLFQAVEKLRPLDLVIPEVCAIQWTSENQFPLVSRVIETLTETSKVALGGAAVTGLMHRAVLVGILRGLLAQRVHDHGVDDSSDSDWLSAFLDPFVGEALRAIHREPGVAWTVQKLAGCSGISRSGFAARFRTLLGKPPLQYVTEFRMKRAAELLASGTDDVQDVSQQLGYDSASAFSTAFKRVHGISPVVYRANEHATKRNPPVVREFL